MFFGLGGPKKHFPKTFIHAQSEKHFPRKIFFPWKFYKYSRNVGLRPTFSRPSGFLAAKLWKGTKTSQELNLCNHWNCAIFYSVPPAIQHIILDFFYIFGQIIIDRKAGITLTKMKLKVPFWREKMPYYFDCYEEGGRKRRRTLVIKGVITGVIKGVIKDIDYYEKGGRKREEEKVFC